MCDLCGWPMKLDQLAAMMREGHFDWASHSLRDLRKTLQEKQHVTLEQSKVIITISNAWHRQQMAPSPSPK